MTKIFSLPALDYTPIVSVIQFGKYGTLA